MPQQITNSIENNFIGGLKTENNPLNFPENACTDADNTIFTITGEVNTRGGIDIEANGGLVSNTKTDLSISSYIWNNAGGDGESVLHVVSVGNTLTFFKQSAATTLLPLSKQVLADTIYLPTFSAGLADVSAGSFECQFADGNGYLFVFHPQLNSFYCTYDPNTDAITATQINMQVRDTIGLFEPGVPDNFRSTALTNEHYYNLVNQGWSNTAVWTASSSSSVTLSNSNLSFTVAAGLSITPGDIASVSGLITLPILRGGVSSAFANLSGFVFSYVGTTLVISFSGIPNNFIGAIGNAWSFSKANDGLVTTWHSAAGNYPSNSDVWWNFKDNTNVFNPSTTIANTSLGQGPAPKGSAILNAFDFDRGGYSGTGFITEQGTLLRPKTGTWFQGRIWYTGVDSSIPSVGDATTYSWSENIYFSQVVQGISDFGQCYQINDPTSEDLFDLLPTDGGLIKIQGCGSIYKLFPIQNGLLVFADKGIWFITGSQGIGFAANDYTITKISAVRSISSTSFINVLGSPIFWNEEGIYSVTPGQSGSLEVNNLCVGTIATFYGNIPLQSKKFVRGDYNPIDFVISWVFKSTNEQNTLFDRYNFDRVLSINTSTKAFYPYTIGPGLPSITDLKYVVGSGGGTFPESTFKYLTYVTQANMTFCEENDFINYRDFVNLEQIAGTGIGLDYISYFITGYRIHGQALTKFQPLYLITFSNAQVPTSFTIQGIWDFANDPNSGRWSTSQLVTNALSRFGIIYRRHKIRGRGLALQFKVSSVVGMPFSLIGWSTIEAKNTNV